MNTGDIQARLGKNPDWSPGQLVPAGVVDMD